MVERLDQRFPAEVSLLFLPLATCHRREIVVRVHGWAFFFFSSPLFTILLYLSVYIWLLGPTGRLCRLLWPRCATTRLLPMLLLSDGAAAVAIFARAVAGLGHSGNSCYELPLRVAKNTGGVLSGRPDGGGERLSRTYVLSL